MSADLSAWLSAGNSALRPTANEAQRAALAWRRINDKPASIAFRTQAGSTLAAQAVRIESDSNASQSMSDAGKAATRRIVIFGVRNHETVTDTDIEAGYRFVYGSSEYRVVSVVATLGEVQGVSEAVS